MSEPWTDERIREAFIYDGGESEYHDPISGASEQRRFAGGIFDAWLERHDAALRAEWEAEQGWEYTFMRPETGYPDDFAGLPSDGIERALEVATLFPGEVRVIHRRRKAGPWMPVEQGKTTKTEGNER